MDLTSDQRKLLRQGLESAFDPYKLQMFLSEDLGRQIHNYAMDGPFDYRVFKLIEGAEAEGWFDELVVKAVETRPKQAIFARLAGELGLAPGISAFLPIGDQQRTDTRGVLQSIVDGQERFFDVEAFLTQGFVLQGQICRIETTNADGNGTGFLVGPDLVLTNYHVMEPVLAGTVAEQDVVFRFDYRRAADGVTIRPGVVFRLKTGDWCVEKSKYSAKDLVVDQGDPAPSELDYCLVRLSVPAGEAKAGGSQDPNADDRGWITANLNQNPGAPADDIFIMQHPKGQPLQFAVGEHLGLNPAENRVRYDADTLGGSSGSPIFNSALDLIGLHHRGDPEADVVAMTAEHNQGIPIAKILAHMAQEGVTAFWEL